MEVNTKKNSRQPNFNQLTDYFVSNHVCPICYSEDIKPVRPSAIKLKIDEIDNEFAANWCLCSSCGHVFRERMLNTVGKSFALNPFDVPFTRVDSFRLLNKTASYINNNQDNSQIKNLFIYPQDITMFATGVEFGYSMSALVEPLRFDEYKKVSGSVLAGDLMTVNINGIPNAIHIGRYLERAQDALATLQRLSNILDIGGLLTLVFSNVGSYEWNLINKEKTCPIWDDPQSTQLYRRNLLIKSAKEHGFEYVRSVPIVDNIAGVFMILRKVK